MRRRFAQSTFAQVTDALWELDNINDDRIPNPVEYLECKRGTGGGRWVADMVEMVTGAELPAAVVGTRPARVLRDTFGDAAYLRNDLFSYQREIEEEGEVNNSVLVLQRFLDMNPQQAADTVNDLITSRVQQFENTALTELPILFDEHTLSPAERLNILRYAKGLQDWQAGLHAWMLQSPRYAGVRNHAAAWLGPRGLGTAAARLWASYRPVDRNPRPFTTPELTSRFPVRVNPHLPAVRSAAKAWAARMGMLDGTVWDQQSFDATDFAAWVARTHPDAPPSRLQTVTLWYVWANYLDDVIDTGFKPRRDLLGAKVYLSRLAEFLPADPADMPVPANPVERGLADLWPATALDMTDRLRRIFPEHIQDWIEGVVWALAAIVQQRVPDPIDYLEMRRQTTGAGFSLDLLQHALSIELPAAVAALPQVARLNDIFADNNGWHNDLRSYAKEIGTEGEMGNGVLVLHRFLGCDLQHAANIVRDLLQVRQSQFDRLAAAPALAGPDVYPVLRQYLNGMRYWMGGDWSWATERYQRVDSTPTVTGKPCVGTRNPPVLGGLGTSAARLIPTRVG
jgi:germacradienol/geosmin synthase